MVPMPREPDVTDIPAQDRSHRPPVVEPTPPEVPDVLPGEPSGTPVPGDPVPGPGGPVRDPITDPTAPRRKRDDTSR